MSRGVEPGQVVGRVVYIGDARPVFLDRLEGCAWTRIAELSEDCMSDFFTDYECWGSEPTYRVVAL